MALDGGKEYLYDTLSGIGALSALANGTSNGHTSDKNEIEEEFIPLLDVLEDDATGTKSKLIPEKKETQPDIRSDPPGLEAPSTSGRTDLPWARASKKIQSPSLRLHYEIVEFCRFLEPTSEEISARRDALSRITDLVTSIFPQAEVKLFGSFLTGLYLPTSDMDCVVVNSGCDDIPRGLRAIGNLLVEEGLAKNIQVIAKAKVPIVKFDDIATGLAFDISFDVANGPKTAEFVTKMMKTLPPMRRLVMVLKLFLQQRDLNEVYQGGIGSYALLVMVAAFLLQHPSRMPRKDGSKPKLEENMGLLLIEFFRLYGRTLDYEHVGVSCRKGGKFFPKTRNRFLQSERPYFLAVEDPQDPDNDLAKGSYNVGRVQKAFDFAYQQLSSPIDPADSALQRIFRLDAVLTSRTPAIDATARQKADDPIDLTMDDHSGSGSDSELDLRDEPKYRKKPNIRQRRKLQKQKKLWRTSGCNVPKKRKKWHGHGQGESRQGKRKRKEAED